ncbi:Hypothetical protein HVR_LOCUS1130 [uncultured virus]|nr:Hypothetical protein HVR_LOCUS1130 [uncultured virus]
MNLIDFNSPEKYVNQMEKEAHNNNCAGIVDAYFKFTIRSRQDIACSNDVSCGSFVETMKMFIFPKYFGQVDCSKLLNTETYLKVAKEIKQDTEQDKLEDPSWVVKYGMQGPYFNQNPMKSSNEWKKIRLDVINEGIEQLQKAENK